MHITPTGLLIASCALIVFGFVVVGAIALHRDSPEADRMLVARFADTGRVLGLCAAFVFCGGLAFAALWMSVAALGDWALGVAGVLTVLGAAIVIAVKSARGGLEGPRRCPRKSNG